MYRGIKLLLLLVCVSRTVSAQDELSKDLDRIVAHMDSLSSMSIEASVKVYGRKGGSVIYATNAAVYRNAAGSLTKLGDQEYFISKDYDVTVDHDEKAVLILKKSAAQPGKAKKQSVDFDAAALKKLLEPSEKAPQRKVVLVSNQNGKKTYSVSNVPGMKEVRMVVNMTELSIESVTYEYSEESENKGQYVSVIYTRFKKGADVSAILQPSNYFSESNGTYVLVPRLKNYKIYTEL